MQYNNLCFGECGLATLGSEALHYSARKQLKDECMKRMSEFVKSPLAKRLVPDLDAQDLGEIQGSIVAVSQMQQYCPYFSEIAPGSPLYEKYFGKGSPKGTSSFRSFLMMTELNSSAPDVSKEAITLVNNDPKVCNWFLDLNRQDKEYLSRINTITYKNTLIYNQIPPLKKNVFDIVGHPFTATIYSYS